MDQFIKPAPQRLKRFLAMAFDHCFRVVDQLPKTIALLTFKSSDYPAPETRGLAR